MGAGEGGVPVGEHPAVTPRQPVALSVRVGGHAHDGSVERRAAVGAGEGGVPVGEHPAVTPRQPEALCPDGGADRECCSGEGRHGLVGGEQIGVGARREEERAPARSRGDPEREERGDGVGIPLGELARRRRQAQRDDGLDHPGSRVGVRGTRCARSVGVVAPATVAVLCAGEEACSVGCRGRREGALCGQALDGKGRGVGVGALVATRIAVARIRRGDVAGPPSVRAPLSGEPGLGCAHLGRVGDAGVGQRCQGESLADGAVERRVLRSEQAGVRSGGALGGQQPGHQVRAAETVRIDAEGMGVEDEQGELTRPVDAVGGDVLVHVGLEVPDGVGGRRPVHSGAGQGQNRVDGGGQVGLPRCRLQRDVAGGGELAGQPRRPLPGRNVLGKCRQR